MFMNMPPQIEAVFNGTLQEKVEYVERAHRGMSSTDPNVKQCVDWLREQGGYGGLGDYASYEYCQWQKENAGGKK